MASLGSGAIVNGFLVKLWKLLENSCDNSIVWSEDGRSFVISDPHAFSQSLPKYFKHSKLSSFIRQLNMYGFRKVTSQMNWSPGDNIKVEDDLHFYHPNFRRGEQDQLALIRRKMPCKFPNASQASFSAFINQNAHFLNTNNGFNTETSVLRGPEELCNGHTSQASADAAATNFDMDELRAALDEVRACTSQQTETKNLILELKQENQVLWRELLELRQKYNNQQEVVGALIKFLFNSIHGHYQTPTVSKNRKISPKLMIGDHARGPQSGQNDNNVTSAAASAYPGASLASYTRQFSNMTTENQQLNLVNSIDNYEQFQRVQNNGSSPVSLVAGGSPGANPPPTTASAAAAAAAASTNPSTNNQIAYDITNWLQEQMVNDPSIEDFMELFEGQIPEDQSDTASGTTEMK